MSDQLEPTVRLNELSPAGYFRWMLSSAAVCVLLVAMVNFLVDPYYVFDATTLRGVNLGKPAVINRTGFAKTYMVERVAANTVIAGASRTDVGLDPENSSWPDNLRPVFNYGVPGSALYDRLRYLQQATAINRPELAVVEIDFAQFLDPLDANPGPFPPLEKTFEKRLRATLEGTPTPSLAFQRTQDKIASLLSTTALFDSAVTLGDQRYVSPTALGLSSGPQRFEREVRSKGAFSVMRDTTRRYGDRYSKGVRLERDPAASMDLGSLRAILDFARENEIRLVLIIPPSHVFQYETWDLYGLWDDFESWKAIVLGEIEGSKSRQPNGPPDDGTRQVELWDFSGYDERHRELVPEARDKATRMHWFWEPVHFKVELGNLIIASITNGGSVDYGRILTLENLCESLAEDRAARAKYRSNHPDQTAMLKEILGDTNLAAADRWSREPKIPVCGR